jgi:hypothetical protein
MKIRSAILLSLLTISICQAQRVVKKSVALLKESPKIDSLMKLILAIPEKAAENDSCLLIRLDRNKNDAGSIEGIHTLNHNRVIFDLWNFKDQKDLGCFEFEGYLIFVYGNEFMNDFFTKTGSKKEFDFIKPSVEESVFMIRHFMGWTLFYKNGQFNYEVH